MFVPKNIHFTCYFFVSPDNFSYQLLTLLACRQLLENDLAFIIQGREDLSPFLPLLHLDYAERKSDTILAWLRVLDLYHSITWRLSIILLFKNYFFNIKILVYIIIVILKNA